MELWEEKKITRIDECGRYDCTDILIKEDSYHLFINEKHIHTFACTPADLKDLAVGYAFTEGIVKSAAQIKTVTVDCKKHLIQLDLFDNYSTNYSNNTTGNECILLSQNQIFQMWEIFNSQCELFRLTGAAHAIGLTDGKQILFIKEDVARHNALAKVIGKMVLEGIVPGNKAMIFSGRLALEMIKMVETTGIKMLLCHGTTTAPVVNFANDLAITLAGFVKRNYMNIYTHSERIQAED